MRELWLEAVSRAFPDRPQIVSGGVAACPGYPLLGNEVACPAPGAEVRPWRLRLALCETFQPDLLAALIEDVQEIRLLAAGGAMKGEVSGLDLFLEGEPSSGAWSLLSQEDVTVGAWSGRRVTWGQGEQTLVEQTLLVDSMVLKNLALLGNLSKQHPEVDRWVVASAASCDGQAESLIADTLAYWSGAVAGVNVLEVEQQPGEGFDTLWARLGICRLLRWEADLAQPGDALSGAGLFVELAAS